MPLGPGSTDSIRTRIGLTGRGWWFLASGLAVAAVGLLQRWTPVVQFGALVALLPLAAALLTRGPRAGLVLHRELSSRELACGDQLSVTVGVRGRFPRGHSLLVEDLAPAALGGPHRFAINGMSGQGLSRSYYRLRVGVRGVHHVGPMRIHVIDRFGMVHRVVTTGGRDEVVVHPPVIRLNPQPLAGASVGAGSGHLGARGAATDDVIPREYHPGDEVRRMDWKASARTGGLMVRSEENPWRAAVTVVVDLQEADHRGVEPESSADASLSMAASIGCLALENGWDLTVLTTDDDRLFSGSPMTGVTVERRALLLALATVTLSRSTVPAPSLTYSTATASGPLILVAGRLGPSAARLLSRIGSHNPTRILVAVAAEHWAPRDSPGSPGPPEAAGSRGADADLAEFGLAGWRRIDLVGLGPGTEGLTRAITQAWAGLAVRR